MASIKLGISFVLVASFICIVIATLASHASATSSSLGPSISQSASGVGGGGGPGAGNGAPKKLHISPRVYRYLARQAANSGADDEDWFLDEDNLVQKRQYDDYGHMRFGKRQNDFDDYGHLRFGK